MEGAKSDLDALIELAKRNFPEELTLELDETGELRPTKKRPKASAKPTPKAQTLLPVETAHEQVKTPSEDEDEWEVDEVDEKNWYYEHGAPYDEYDDTEDESAEKEGEHADSAGELAAEGEYAEEEGELAAEGGYDEDEGEYAADGEHDENKGG